MKISEVCMASANYVLLMCLFTCDTNTFGQYLITNPIIDMHLYRGNELHEMLREPLGNLVGC